eukprot:scaffold5036_cov117-Isochrysis_galbana.AAC.2
MSELELPPQAHLTALPRMPKGKRAQIQAPPNPPPPLVHSACHTQAARRSRLHRKLRRGSSPGGAAQYRAGRRMHAHAGGRPSESRRRAGRASTPGCAGRGPAPLPAGSSGRDGASARHPTHWCGHWRAPLAQPRLARGRSCSTVGSGGSEPAGLTRGAGARRGCAG